MPVLKDLRNRIASVKATRKITKAMQMVAAAKLRRAQEAADAARPYAERMEAVLANLAAALQGRERRAAAAGRHRQGRGASARGRAPPSAACAAASTPPSSGSPASMPIALLAEGKTVKILCVGKKGRDQLSACTARSIVEVDRSPRRQAARLRRTPSGSPTRCSALFDAGEFDVGNAVLLRFQSVISQMPTALQLIPAELPRKPAGASAARRRGLRVRARRGEILADLLPRNIATQIFRALLENAASEQGARMSAMDNATRNAGDMINKLTIKYNRQRQAQITKELIEIISGAEAL